jgi:hypothetical protein
MFDENNCQELSVVEAVEEMDDEAKEWIRSRPDHIKQIMMLFPPGCNVIANRPLVIPPPGEIRTVVSYFEDGSIGVYDEDTNCRAQCQPEWLELFSENPICTTKHVRELLEDDDAGA